MVTENHSLKENNLCISEKLKKPNKKLTMKVNNKTYFVQSLVLSKEICECII